MRKWKCIVCGYIHTGEEPPEKCPVCGAPRSKFIEVTEPEAPAPETAAAVAPESEPEPAAAKTPEPAAAAEAVVPEPASPFKDSRYRRLFEMMTKFHGHPISVHIPNGLLPVAILFIVLAALFGIESMATAATYNLGVVALSMPLVLFSGWVDWQNRFNGAITNVFTVKIACGIVVTVTAWFLFIWLLINPEVITTPQPSRVAFFLINLIMLGAAGTAGWYGGKLVFRD
jgi:uncharacterized membrane protein